MDIERLGIDKIKTKQTKVNRLQKMEEELEFNEKIDNLQSLNQVLERYSEYIKKSSKYNTNSKIIFILFLYLFTTFPFDKQVNRGLNDDFDDTLI
ncbi:hypothetical protein ABPG74_010541 [Tetrahymena malaccensis]